MMKRNLFLTILLLSFPVFAQHITSPTKASKPLPSLSETQNIDTVVTEKVQTAITKAPSLKGQAVSAASRKGVVTLQGSVASKKQEQDAINAAKSVREVKKVKSQLTIKARK